MKHSFTIADIIRYRLFNQQIASTKFTTPEQIVEWLAAIQSQDYGMAKWAIGLRLPGSDEAMIEKAFNEGKILRTHLLRPTWHFVTPADIRWLLALTAPRVKKFCSYMYRKLELDNKILNRSNAVLEKTLEGKHLIRSALKSLLAKAKIRTDENRLSHLLMNAELDGIICSGPRQGRQFTYALLNERVPHSKVWDREKSLAELATRYFTTRGPATLQDFVWWSGLTVNDARKAVGMLPAHFKHEEIEGLKYVLASTSTSQNNRKVQTTFLLPDYDEYGISYKDRSAVFNTKNIGISRLGGNPVFNHMIIIDGQAGGTWERVIKKNKITVETSFFKPMNKAKHAVVKAAVKNYCSFFG